MGRTASNERRALADYLAQQAGKKSIAELAEELGMSPAYIRCTAQSYGISMRMTKLTADDHRLMRALRSEGLTLESIAEKFEVGLWKTSEVCKGIKRGNKEQVSV